MPVTDRFRVSGSAIAGAMARRRTGTGSSRVEKTGPARLPRPVQIVQLSVFVYCAIYKYCKLHNLHANRLRVQGRLRGGEGRRRRPRAKAGPARVWDV